MKKMVFTLALLLMSLSAVMAQTWNFADRDPFIGDADVALINADETGKAITTKEFVDNKISNFSLPTNWESPQQRFSGLEDKSSDATYNKTLVVDNNGNMAYNKDVTGVLYNGKSYYLKNRNFIIIVIFLYFQR